MIRSGLPPELPQPEDPEVHWDPPPPEREWYAHRRTGELGYIVRREGKEVIRMDRGPHVDDTRPFKPEIWRAEHSPKDKTRMQMAMVAWWADRELLRQEGRHQEARKDWLALSDRDRIGFMDDGPNDPKCPLRHVLWSAVMATLSLNTGEG